MLLVDIWIGFRRSWVDTISGKWIVASSGWLYTTKALISDLIIMALTIPFLSRKFKQKTRIMTMKGNTFLQFFSSLFPVLMTAVPIQIT